MEKAKKEIICSECSHTADMDEYDVDFRASYKSNKPPKKCSLCGKKGTDYLVVEQEGMGEGEAENWEEEFYKRFESEINGLGSVWEIHKIKSFIRQLLSQQKQDIIENMKITQFDVDDVMNQWTDYDWVDAWKDDIEIADLINAKIKSKLNKNL
jgi:hypothetical protein